MFILNIQYLEHHILHVTFCDMFVSRALACTCTNAKASLALRRNCKLQILCRCWHIGWCGGEHHFHLIKFHIETSMHKKCSVCLCFSVRVAVSMFPAPVWINIVNRAALICRPTCIICKFIIQAAGVTEKEWLSKNFLKYACGLQDYLFMRGCVFHYVEAACVSLLLTENHSGNKYAMWMQLKRFSMGWGDIWPKAGYSVQLCLLLLCRCCFFPLEGNSCLISFIFLSCLQISTLASVWWLELPPWTQWCPASVWYLHLSPKTYQLSRRSSTAKAAPCSPPTPVSHSIMLILHRLPSPVQSFLLIQLKTPHFFGRHRLVLELEMQHLN